MPLACHHGILAKVQANGANVRTVRLGNRKLHAREVAVAVVAKRNVERRVIALGHHCGIGMRLQQVGTAHPRHACPYVFVCRGGCGSDAKRRTGSPFCEECGEFKEMFSYAASRELARRWKNMGKDELSVSLYGPLSRMTPDEREELMTTTSGNRVIEILQQVGLTGGGDSSATTV